MKRRLMNSLSMALAASLLAIPLFGEAVLIAKPSVFDFGTISEGIIVPVTFSLTNTGTSKVQIGQIRSFGACVQTEPIETESLAPGQTLVLEYRFLSVGYGGISIANTIEIHYNHSQLSPLKLQVRGMVLPLKSYQAHLGDLTYNYEALIDIRSPAQFKKGHILGAVNVPAGRLKDWVKTFAGVLPPEIRIFLISKDGIRSDEAAEMLRAQGYPQFCSTVGGMQEWSSQFGGKLIISDKESGSIR